MSACRDLPKGEGVLSAYHEVGLGVTIIFMYNMLKWDGSRRQGRFCPRHRRRRWYRSGTFTMKSGLACRPIWCIICLSLYEVVPGVQDAAEVDVFVAGSGDVGAGGPAHAP